MAVQHKGWDWDAVKPGLWDEISEEFLPVALNWVKKYHTVLDIGIGRGRHAFFFADNGFKVSAIDLSESSIAYVKGQIKERNFEILSMNKTINYVRKGEGTHGVHYYVHVVKK